MFPEYFPAIEDQSFPAVWVAGKNPKRAVEAALRLGSGPYFIKDYAKSAKEIWPTGCVAKDDQELPATIKTLVKYRGDHFEGGIVVRPLMRLRYIDEHPFGGKIFEEYRLFFFLGRMISVTSYARVGGNVAELPDYRFLAQRVQSPFFSADIVVTEEGKPYVLEVGDGGVQDCHPVLLRLIFIERLSRCLVPAGDPHSTADWGQSALPFRARCASRRGV